MKSPSLLCNTLAALLAVALATPLAAQQQAAKHHNYKVLDVGTLGGPTSGFNFNSRIINRKGAAAAEQIPESLIQTAAATFLTISGGQTGS